MKPETSLRLVICLLISKPSESNIVSISMNVLGGTLWAGSEDTFKFLDSNLKLCFVSFFLTHYLLSRLT